MADKPLNRTYSRISRQPTRKPLGKYTRNGREKEFFYRTQSSPFLSIPTLIGTFNSAPFLPKVTHSVFKPSDDSLDDFVVTKKYVRKKTAKKKKDPPQPTKNHVVTQVDGEDDDEEKEGAKKETSSEDPLSFGSSPTPVFRTKDDTFDK